MKLNTVICGDCLEIMRGMEDNSVDCCITSPPYWALRDYGVEGQLGLEPTFQEYITRLCDIFDEVKRVLKKEGTCWVNMGDTYGGTGIGQEKSMGSKAKQTAGQYEDAKQARNIKNLSTKGKYDKCLLQIPSRFAIEMCNRGWILRNEIIWHKPNCMPSSAKDRFTVDFEKIFFFTKSKKYWFETQYEKHLTQESRPDGIVREREYGYDTKYPEIRQKRKIDKTAKFFIDKGSGGNINLPQPASKQGRNKRCVWEIPTKPYSEAHFATYPPALIETPIKAGCPKGGIVLDPFFGSGTSGLVAKNLNRNYIGIELNKDYLKIAERRLSQGVLNL